MFADPNRSLWGTAHCAGAQGPAAGRAARRRGRRGHRWGEGAPESRARSVGGTVWRSGAKLLQRERATARPGTAPSPPGRWEFPHACARGRSPLRSSRAGSLGPRLSSGELQRPESAGAQLQGPVRPAVAWWCHLPR